MFICFFTQSSLRRAENRENSANSAPLQSLRETFLLIHPNIINFKSGRGKCRVNRTTKIAAHGHI